MNERVPTIRFCAALGLILLGAASPAWARPPLDEMFEQSYPLSRNATLTVRNTDGTIYIYASEGETLKVTARKRAYSEERLKKIAINVTSDGDNAVIDTVYPLKPAGLSFADRSGTVDYLILVPQNCTIAQAELTSGEIIVEGLRGRATNVRLTNGHIIARNCFSDVHIALAEGGLDVYYDWWEPVHFAFTAEIGHGHIAVDLPSYCALHLDAVSGDGKITNQFAPFGNGEARVVNMQIGQGNSAEFQLRAPGGNILIHKGD